MNNDVAIKVNHVKKTFKLPTESSSSLKRTVTNYFKGIKGFKEQTVLKDIDFQVNQGDFFGIVGRNGSGKSTLLKIISQIYVPEQGTVTINGKLVSFIELGVGFNPELTGRENVYLNGALLGFSTKEVDEMYDDIVTFAELGEFMNQKLKNYSSGMQVRLAFSVAIQAKSDILVLDEVLAVGDEAFQRKCNDYFMKAKEDKTKTIVLVTHSMDAVRRYCNRAMMIDKGEVKVIGSPDEVANQYSLDNVIQTAPESQEANEEAQEQGEVDTGVKNLSIKLLTDKVLDPDNKNVRFEISFDQTKEMDIFVAFSLTDLDRNAWMYNDNSYETPVNGIGPKRFIYSCDLNALNQCNLQLTVSVRDIEKTPLAFSDSENSPIIVIPTQDDLSDSALDSSTGIIERNGSWEITAD